MPNPAGHDRRKPADSVEKHDFDVGAGRFSLSSCADSFAWDMNWNGDSLAGIA
ncbi:hypothetical protein P3T16_006274, partial [Paraburkholderia sp. GAS42]